MEHQGNALPIIQLLMNPTCYPQPVDRVTLVQTHISDIFLAGPFAYKVKKPVNLGFLDYSTLDRRAYYCRREVELNRRLCPDLYLGVQPIVATAKGARIGGDGEPLDWCVVMKRLPEDRLLSALLVKGDVDVASIIAVAQKLANFHAQSKTGDEIDEYGHPAQIRVNTDENFRQIRPYLGESITPSQHDYLSAYVDAFLDKNERLFSERVTQHRIRDCHGDLHASSVCLAEDIWIFDCIEFNDRFRYGDVAAEVAFLAMDLERYGRADLAWHFVDAYRRASDDPLPDLLLDFYACYRALVRAKVQSFKLTDPAFPAEEKNAAKDIARVYVDLATAHAGLIQRPSLVLINHHDTQSTTRAQDISRRFGLVHLAPIRPVTRPGRPGSSQQPGDTIGVERYRKEVENDVDADLLVQTREWLRRGRGVIVEKPMTSPGGWSRERELAQQFGIPLLELDSGDPAGMASGTTVDDDRRNLAFTLRNAASNPRKRF